VQAQVSRAGIWENLLAQDARLRRVELAYLNQEMNRLVLALPRIQRVLHRLAHQHIERI
jgi:hypothetical protein